MKLHDSIGPNPRAVRIAIAEQGLAVDTVTVDIMKGENRQPGYLALVPSGGTPALVLGNGQAISEITAIIEYLDEQPGAVKMVGNTPEERAETRMWTRRIDHAILEPMANAFRASEGRPMFASRMTLVSLEAAAELKAIAQEKLLWLDAQMQGRTWICGDRYSMADALLLAFVEFGASVGQPMPASATWLPEWHKRAAARPSAAA
ncbi:MAG: glutathione S-transferase family protein [Polymorphobacter sp.]